MARYEGMDDILDRMRQRLLNAGASSEPQRLEAVAAAIWRPDAVFTDILDCMLGLLREAERLERLLRGGHLQALTSEQSDALRASLGNVLAELLACEELLHQSTRFE